MSGRHGGGGGPLDAVGRDHPLSAEILAPILALYVEDGFEDAIKRCGTGFAYQGNMDPGCLFGSKEFITKRIEETIGAAREAGVRHVMNLGHGVLPTTPEENVAHYFKVCRELRY